MKRNSDKNYTHHLSIDDIEKHLGMSDEERISRRQALIDGLKTIGGFAFAVSVLGSAGNALADVKWKNNEDKNEKENEPEEKPKAKKSSTSGNSTVVDIYDKDVVNSSGEGEDGPVHDMLNRAMVELTGERDYISAFKRIVKPGDRVGLKVSCIAGRNLSTQVPVAMAIVDGLIKAGVKPGDIIIWERSDRELKNAGYTISTGTDSLRCFGTPGYESRENDIQGTKFKLSKILTDEIDVLINVPVMKNHGGSGVTLSLKNHYGSHNNPGDHHGNSCDPYIAHVCSHQIIKSKTKLVVVDALRAQCNGGPSDKPQWKWNASRLLVGFDPVAIDRIGSDIIDEQRKVMGVNPLGQSHRHIITAAQMGLGTDDRSKIDIRKLVV